MITQPNYENRGSLGPSQTQFLLIGVPSLLIIVWVTLVALFLSFRFDWILGPVSPAALLSHLIARNTWIRALLPLILVLLVFHVLFSRAQSFIFDLYRPAPQERAEIKERIWHRLWGWYSVFLSRKFVVINDTILSPANRWSAWLGGPAYLVIFDGFAAYLERGNHFSRVVGPGFPIAFLGTQETIRVIVDLRPWSVAKGLEVWTRDGIRVKLAIRAEIQIEPGTNQGSSDSALVYPFNEQAVKKAVESTAVRVQRGQLQEVDWREASMEKIGDFLSRHIASNRLNALLHGDGQLGQMLSAEVIGDLGKNLKISLKEEAGVLLTSLQITSITISTDDPHPDVSSEEKATLLKRMQGGVDKQKNRILMKARAEAQKDLITSIARSVVNSTESSETLLLSLSSIINQSLDDVFIRSYLANETLNTFEKLRSVLGEEGKTNLHAGSGLNTKDTVQGDIGAEVTANLANDNELPVEDHLDSEIDSKNDRDKKSFRVSVAFPLLLSKKFESVFLFQLYLPDVRSRVNKNIRAQFHEQLRTEFTEQSKIKIGQRIQVEFFNPHFEFSKPVTKSIEGALTKIIFLGSPKEACQLGSRSVRVSISDAESQEEIESFTIEVRVVDFAFDHVSRPFFSRVSATLLGIGSVAMFTLSLLEQVDKTIGLTSGTAAGILATLVYANFYNLYQRVRSSPP